MDLMMSLGSSGGSAHTHIGKGRYMYMSHSLDSFKGVNIGDYIGDYYRGYYGGY